MKKLCLILLLLVCTITGFAQVNSLGDAFSKFHSGDYQSAIKLYREKIAKKATLYDVYMLGMSYYKADSIAQAEQQFKKIILGKDDEMSPEDIKTEACDRLAGLYLKEKNYTQALYYYRLYVAIFEKARFDDVNWARFHFFNVNDQARCYNALGLTDSAIRVMTPYMFYTYKALNQMMIVGPNYTNLKDSLQHDSISRFYLALLQSRYTNKQIKAEFQKAEQSFMFIEERKPIGTKGFWSEDIKCSINVYNTNVVFMEIGIADEKEKLLKEIQEPRYTKAYQLDYFRKLPVYRMVMDLPK